MDIKRQLQQLLQDCKEELLITAEVRSIRSDDEFQKKYGLSDEEMAALKAAWYQVELPLYLRRLAIVGVVSAGALLGIIYLILKVLL